MYILIPKGRLAVVVPKSEEDREEALDDCLVPCLPSLKDNWAQTLQQPSVLLHPFSRHRSQITE